MKSSKHALIQAQRRGIKNEYMKIVEDYGVDYKATRNATLRLLTRRSQSELHDENPILWKKYRDKKIVLIKSKNDMNITVMHEFKKIKRDR